MEQDFSRSNSTYLNVAYRTLKDPTLRAKYLVPICLVIDCMNRWRDGLDGYHGLGRWSMIGQMTNGSIKERSGSSGS